MNFMLDPLNVQARKFKKEENKNSISLEKKAFNDVME